MPTKQKITPHKVTKPIQLLATWLVGLIIVNGSFLTTAALLESGSWERVILVVAAVLNVPVFLYSMFLLQTRFRPEMQEDIFYSQYLDKKTNQIVTINKSEKIEADLLLIKDQVTSLVASSSIQSNKEEKSKLQSKKSLGYKWKVALNDYLDNFKEIRLLLKKEGIPLSEIFGSSYSSDEPKHKIITISRQVDFNSKRQILLLAPQMGIEAYNYLPIEEEGMTDPILIGSYGSIDEETVPISPELIELLKSDAEPVDLRHFESKVMKAVSAPI